MKDRFGREITYLRMSVTELCNLRCRYCMPAEGVCKRDHGQMLTQEEMLGAVRVAAELGVRKLRVTGGEPLVKRNIVAICEGAAAIPGIEEICLTTNGILLPRLAKPLKQAGVSRLNISLDTLDADKYAWMTRLGTLDMAMKGIEAALDAGFERVKINAVLIGGAANFVAQAAASFFLKGRFELLKGLFREGVIDHITVTHTFSLNVVWIALFLYLLSYIFAYGEELQRQSDETL